MSANALELFAGRHLGGRTVPDDLRKLLQAQWQDAASGKADRLRTAGVTFLDQQMPAAVAAISTGHDDLGSAARIAAAQAMGDMLRCCGFVAEDAAGDGIGYWFGPDAVPIDQAALVQFDRRGSFVVLPGQSISEAVVYVAARGDEEVFATLRDALRQYGLDIQASTLRDLRPRACASDPQLMYERLMREYSSDLSGAAAPDVGEPVHVLTMHRGPKIGPEND
jgi:hypothetical protein